MRPHEDGVYVLGLGADFGMREVRKIFRCINPQCDRGYFHAIVREYQNVTICPDTTCRCSATAKTEG